MTEHKHPAPADPVDKYGNREGKLRYCCFPDCGCDGARLCMAEEGPSWSSTQLNLEKGAPIANVALKATS